MLDFGVDAVIAQGGEGGGHTGTVPTSLLLPQVVDAVGHALPVLGAGGEDALEQVRYVWEDLYLEASRGDDFLGVQAYSSQAVDSKGLVAHPPHPDNTLTGAAYRPDALGMAVRHAAAVAGVPILITENGIATADDSRRIDYIEGALAGLASAVADGIDVRGYLHWTSFDNFEWSHGYHPTFGLIGIDRDNGLRRVVRPSAVAYGELARTGSLKALRDHAR